MIPRPPHRRQPRPHPLRRCCCSRHPSVPQTPAARRPHHLPAPLRAGPPSGLRRHRRPFRGRRCRRWGWTAPRPVRPDGSCRQPLTTRCWSCAMRARRNCPRCRPRLRRSPCRRRKRRGRGQPMRSLGPRCAHATHCTQPSPSHHPPSPGTRGGPRPLGPPTKAHLASAASSSTSRPAQSGAPVTSRASTSSAAPGCLGRRGPSLERRGRGGMGGCQEAAGHWASCLGRLLTVGSQPSRHTLLAGL